MAPAAYLQGLDKVVLTEAPPLSSWDGQERVLPRLRGEAGTPGLRQGLFGAVPRLGLAGVGGMAAAAVAVEDAASGGVSRVRRMAW